eukprot:m.463792 g.463792  ORF g.463792 m.463792 type:complete len:183 (+) comp23170_c0_seq1:177-725(+)
MASQAPIKAVLQVSDTEHPDAVQSLAALLDSPAVFFVDWREDPDDIAAACQECLRHHDPAGPSLSSHYPEQQDDGDANADVLTLVLTVDGQTEVVELTDGKDHRDTTLLALNRLLQPRYEIRWVRELSTTAAFVVLQTSQWEALLLESGPTVDAWFVPLSEANPVFGDCSLEETQKPWWQFW